MNTESQQHSKFNHEEWIDRLSRFMDTAQQFSMEFFQAFKTLSQKGLLEAWKEIRSSASKLTTVDFIFAGFMISVGLFGVLIFLVGIGLLSYQSFLWLQNGVWTEYPLFVIFNFLFENTPLHQWMTHPESWFGLQKLFLWLLESVPVSLALVVPGFSISFIAGGIFAAALAFRYYQFKKMQ